MDALKHTFGTDPEVFMGRQRKIVDKLSLVDIVPPASLAEDMKVEFKEKDDKKVLLSDNKFQWSEDGAAIEAQMSPTNSISTFSRNITQAISALRIRLQPLSLMVYHDVVGYFDVNTYWKTRGEDFRMCVIFGCDPDQTPERYYLQGFEEFEDKVVLDVSEHTFRYGGGHLHIQAPENNPDFYFKNWEIASMVFDFFIGLRNVMLSRDTRSIDLEKKRLEYYGKPGRIRLQEYPKGMAGIEYRPMSNYWLRNPTFIKNILTTADCAAEILEENMGEEFLSDFDQDIPEVYNALTSFDPDKASMIYKKILTWLTKTDLVTLSSLGDMA